MVVQFDKRLSDPFFRYADDLPHQEHEWEKDFCNEASEPMRQKNILSSQDGDDQKEAAGDHQEDQKAQSDAKNKRQGRVNVS